MSPFSCTDNTTYIPAINAAILSTKRLANESTNLPTIIAANDPTQHSAKCTTIQSAFSCTHYTAYIPTIYATFRCTYNAAAK
jgi:hypothetical protein